MTQGSFFTEDNKTGDRQKSVSVLVPFPVDKAYSYSVPKSFDVQPGDYVRVPFKNRDVNGVVWNTDDSVSKKLKPILFKHDVSPLPEDHRKFIEWAARYTASPLGSILKMTMSTNKALEEEKPVTAYKLSASDTA